MMAQIAEVPEPLSPHKRKPSKHVTENGNPLAKKKSKAIACTATQSSMESAMSTGSSNVSSTRSTNVSAPKPAPVSWASPHCAQPCTQHCAAIDTDGNSEDPLIKPEPIELSDSNSMELIEDDLEDDAL
jgi:hypothetical protein